MTLDGKNQAKEKAIECGFDESVYVCSHDMLDRYFFDIGGDNDTQQELLIYVNSSNYSLSKEKLDKLRNDCIDSDHKHSLKTVKRQLRHIGVADEEINNMIGGTLGSVRNLRKLKCIAYFICTLNIELNIQK